MHPCHTRGGQSNFLKTRKFAVFWSLRSCMSFVFARTKAIQFSASKRSTRRILGSAAPKFSAVCPLKKRYACVTGAARKRCFLHFNQKFESFPLTFSARCAHPLESCCSQLSESAIRLEKTPKPSELAQFECKFRCVGHECGRCGLLFAVLHCQGTRHGKVTASRVSNSA